MTLIAIALLSGCTTTIAFKDTAGDKSPLPSLHGKKVGLVIDPSQIPNENTTTSEFETFEFKDIAVSIRDSLKQQIGAEAGAIEIITSLPNKNSQEFAFYFRPTASARSVYDFWTYGCLMTYKLEVLGSSQELLVSSSDQAKRNFMFTGQADSKCNLAMQGLINSVNEKAFSKLNQIPHK